MPDHAGDTQPAFWLGFGLAAFCVKMPAVEVGVGRDGAARHFIESDVFSREVGRRGDHQRMAHARRVLQGPGQRLHAAQRATHHRGQGFDAQGVQQASLGVDPVFHRHHRKVGAVNAAGVRVDMHRSGGTKTGAQVVHANHEEPVGVQRFAGPDHAVPPALGFLLPRVYPGHMVRGVQRMADQHGVGFVGVQCAVGFITEVVRTDRRATLQGKWRLKQHRLGRGNQHLDKKKPGVAKGVTGLGVSLAEFIKRPQAEANRRRVSIGQISRGAKWRPPPHATHKIAMNGHFS